MAFPRTNHLSLDELEQVLDTFPNDALVTVERVRSHNKGDIRRPEQLSAADLKAELLRAHAEEHLPSGDLEIIIKKLGQKLVAHHDGVFWLESE